MANQLTPIRVFDTSLNLVSEVAAYSSAYFQRSWSDVGKFQIEIEQSLGPMFQRGYFVIFGTDTRAVGIVLEILDSLDESGRATRTVTGMECKYLLSRRRVIPPAGQARYYAKTNAETVVKDLVYSQMISATDTDRNISILVNATNSARGPSLILSARYSSVLDEVKTASESTTMGFWVELNLATKKLVFDVGLGLDRTAGQAVNPRAIFSTDFSTLRSAQIASSAISYRSAVYVAGQGTGENRQVVEVGTETGINRVEDFIDARDTNATADLTQRGNAFLTANSNTSFLTGEALSNSSLVYGTDYSLGDIVTVKSMGQSVDTRIQAVTESWDSSGYNLQLEFGSQYPTSASQMREATTDAGQSFQSTEIAISPSGIVSPYAGATAPDGWLLCDGASVTVAAYPALHGVIGYTFGGSGLNFNVPDMRSGYAVGVGARATGRYQSKAVTMTIASPCVVTFTGHDYNTGDQIVFTTTGALPTGLAVNTQYFVIKINGDTFNLATTLANALAGTKINTSGSQSGTHSISLGVDTFTRGQFKDDQLQGHWHNTVSTQTGAVNALQGTGAGGNPAYTPTGVAQARDATTDGTNGTPRTGLVTRGKSIGLNYIIKT